MKKLVLGSILVLLIAIGGGVFFLLSNLDELVKTAIETYGSDAARTSVRVQSVEIGLQDGSGAIRGLSVANPSGFSSPQVFSLGEIATQVDLKAISEDLVVIDQVRILDPEVFFELNQAGQSNLDQLKQNLATSGSGSSSGGGSGGPEPKLLIRKLLFDGGQIHARVVPLNKDYELELPRIELTDLGGAGGASASQIADQLLKVLSDTALREVKKQGIDQYKKKLQAEVDKRVDAEKQKLKKKVGEQIGNQAEEALKGLFNK